MLSQERGIVFLVFSALCLAGSAFSQNNIVLFDAPDAAITIPVAINAAGTIAGYCAREAAGPHQGFIRDAGGNITLFNPPGSVDTYVGGINHAGTVAGYFTDSTRTGHGFLRDASGNFTVFDVPGTDYTDVKAINDPGDVTGTYFNRHPRFYIRHRDGAITVVEGALIDGTPRGINARGTVVGDGVSEGGFVRESGGKVTLFGVVLSQYDEVTGINASGAICGLYYDLFGNDYHPYVRDPSGNITTFLTERSCGAYGINEAGAITGGCFAGDAFVRNPGGAIRTFGAPPGSDCQNISGTGINGAGVVTGTCGTASSRVHGFVRRR